VVDEAACKMLSPESSPHVQCIVHPAIPALPPPTALRGLSHSAVPRLLHAVARTPRLALLATWWVTVVGPVMIFTESYCSNVFSEIDALVEHNGHVEAAAALARVAGAMVAPQLQPAAAARPAAAHASLLLVVAATLFGLAGSSTLGAAYVSYVAAMGLLQVQLCVVQTESALLVSPSDAAPLFGVLSLCTLLLQCAAQARLSIEGSLVAITLARCSCRQC
jgi:Reduced folate carrier